MAQWVSNNGGRYPQNTNNVLISDSVNANVRVLDSFYTATAFADATGAAFTVTAANGGTIGAVTRADDWTASWTFGLNALWF